MPRLKWVEVCGLRSFGIEQSLIFDEEIALVWGGNSQGKTSVAEAIEFLLSGTVDDRSLRNAYQPDGELTVVRAGIEDREGKERRVERELSADFGRGQDCASRLMIDGVEVQDLSSIGIELAEPPLRAPVLFQHSIRYALSAAPTDRLTYFKALFEIGDLDALADALKGVIDDLTEPPVGMESEITACSADPVIRPVIGDLLREESLTSRSCRTGWVTRAGPASARSPAKRPAPRFRWATCVISCAARWRRSSAVASTLLPGVRALPRSRLRPTSKRAASTPRRRRAST